MSYVFRAPPPLREGCGGSLTCEAAGSIPEFTSLVVGLGLVAGLAMVVYLQDAQAVVAAERDQVLAERDAFEAFAERVSALTPAAQPPTQSPPLTPVTERSTGPTRSWTGTGRR